jgi:hypothetical protein
MHAALTRRTLAMPQLTVTFQLRVGAQSDDIDF